MYCLNFKILIYPVYLTYVLVCGNFPLGGILRGSRRDRLLSKFVENECEKIDRLMELYMR